MCPSLFYHVVKSLKEGGYIRSFRGVDSTTEMARKGHRASFLAPDIQLIMKTSSEMKHFGGNALSPGKAQNWHRCYTTQDL